MTLRYLLDTHMCIYIAQHRPKAVLQRFQQLTVGEVSMSAVTYGELLFGAENSTKRQQSMSLIQELSRLIMPLPISIEAGKYYSAIRAVLEKVEKRLSSNDCWIAAQALALKTTLVTSQPQIFSDIPKLKCESWV